MKSTASIVLGVLGLWAAWTVYRRLKQTNGPIGLTTSQAADASYQTAT